MAQLPSAFSTPYRQHWVPDLTALALIMVLTTLPFWLSSGRLDLWAAKLFYVAEGAEGEVWPVAEQFPWLMLYHSPAWFAAALLVTGLVAILVGSIRYRYRPWRKYGLLFFLAIALGPGLTVNAIFKDHWGRPRPRQLVDFGGTEQYQLPLIPRFGEQGKSFPAGHPSVGFLYITLFWVWRHRRPVTALAALLFALGSGFVLGLGRMAAGAHFLSDVFWSFNLTAVVSLLLYAIVLKIPLREFEESDEHPAGWMHGGLARGVISVGAGGLAALILAGLLLATPHRMHERYEVMRGPESGAETVHLSLQLGRSDIELYLLGDTMPEAYAARWEHRVRGFGFPTAGFDVLNETIEAGPDSPVTLHRYRVMEEGWFTDVEGRVVLGVRPEALAMVRLYTEAGDIFLPAGADLPSHWSLEAPAGEIVLTAESE